MQRFVLLAGPLLVGAALAGCSSSTPPAPSPTAASAAHASSAVTGSGPTSPTLPVEPDGGNGASGTITFTGKVSGTMTVSSCPDGRTAQLVVAIDGQDSTYAGIIDADDFTFVGPDQTGYTLAKGESKPEVSGTTYTVKNTKLIGILNDDTVTASGSVTCP